MIRCIRLKLVLIAGLATTCLSANLRAQDRHYLLDHRAPTGVAGHWSALTKPCAAGQPQPIRVNLPTQGEVTFYAGSVSSAIPVAAPANVEMQVGNVYRFKISRMPEFPGIELYPSVEILDRLHPPAGLEREFPVPIDITEQDIEVAMQERMVTKVIYLEQPDLADPKAQEGGRTRVQDLPATVNLLQAADQRGRPMAILRIGGRIPDSRSPGDGFVTPTPVMISAPPSAK